MSKRKIIKYDCDRCGKIDIIPTTKRITERTDDIDSRDEQYRVLQVSINIEVLKAIKGNECNFVKGTDKIEEGHLCDKCLHEVLTELTEEF